VAGAAAFGLAFDELLQPDPPPYVTELPCQTVGLPRIRYGYHIAMDNPLRGGVLILLAGGSPRTSRRAAISVPSSRWRRGGRETTPTWCSLQSTARPAAQFDAIIHIDRTHALEPLEPTSDWTAGEPPETYPSGL
jgi:hypothetical protein